MLKVIYAVSGLPEWVAVAKNLQNALGWDPCYWIIAPGCEKALDEFPHIIHHDFFQLNRGILPSTIDYHSLPPLDSQIISRFSKYESTAFALMDRMDLGYTFSFQERQRLYYHLLRYWIGIFKTLQPPIVVFTESPHSVAQYLLYVTSIEMGSHTIMFVSTVIPPGLLYLRSRIDEHPHELMVEYSRILSECHEEEIVLSPDKENYLAILRENFSAASPWYVKKHLTTHQKFTKGLHTSKARYLAKLMYIHKWHQYGRFLYIKRNRSRLRIDGQPLTKNYFKLRGVNIEDSVVTNTEVHQYRLEATNYKASLKMHYSRLCDEISLNESYIFIPLHYQPERTTVPEGGHYYNQQLMISLLSKMIPDEWFLYVKEHPTQFYSQLWGEQARIGALYDDIKRLKNTRLVEIDYPTIDLIDHAKAVATVTGTTGWEAICRGIPALVFGNAWYGACEGVFYTPNAADCANAIAQIQDGYVIDHRKVRAFLYTLDKIAIRGYLNPSTAAGTSISFDENVAALTSGIIRYASSIIM